MEGEKFFGHSFLGEPTFRIPSDHPDISNLREDEMFRPDDRQEIIFGSTYVSECDMLQQLKRMGSTNLEFSQKQIEDTRRKVLEDLVDMLTTCPGYAYEELVIFLREILKKKKKKDLRPFLEGLSSKEEMVHKIKHAILYERFLNIRKKLPEDNDIHTNTFGSENLIKFGPYLIIDAYKKMVQGGGGLVGDDKQKCEILSEQELLDAIPIHLARMRDRLEVATRDRLPQIKKDALTFLKTKAGRGELPFTPEEIVERLTSVKVVFLDPLVGGIEQVGGLYYGASGTVYLTLYGDESGRAMTKTLVHEYLHALSGHSFIGTKYELEADEDNEHDVVDSSINGREISYVETQRIGMRFNSIQYMWLNEALTEECIWEDRDSSEDDNDSYVDERKILRQLYSFGLDRDIAYGAYFEQWGEKQGDESAIHNLPKMRDFFLHAKQIFGNSFFPELNVFLEYCQKKDNPVKYEQFQKRAQQVCDCKDIRELRHLMRRDRTRGESDK